MFVEIYPQGDSVYRDIFPICPGGLWVAIPLRSQGILHQSHSGDSEEYPPQPQLAQYLLQAQHQCCLSPRPSLLTSKDTWGHAGRKGRFRGPSEVTAHSRRGRRRELNCVVAAVPSLAVGLWRYVKMRLVGHSPCQPAHYSSVSPFPQPDSCCLYPSLQFHTEYSQAIQWPEQGHLCFPPQTELKRREPLAVHINWLMTGDRVV